MALTEDRLLYGTYELCAEDWLDRHDVAAMVGGATGRQITVGTVDRHGLSADPAPIQPIFEHYDRHGSKGNALTLRAILGRPPCTLRAYFTGLPADAANDKSG